MLTKGKVFIMLMKLAKANLLIKGVMIMMPLVFAPEGEVNVIKKVNGNPQIKSHLETLGFVSGAEVTVINEIAGNLIVNIKETRVAVSKEMAQKIMI